MATDVGIKFGVQGDKEFKSAVTGINSEIKNLKSEMKLAVSEMAGMDNQEEASAKKMDILGRTMDATKEKAKLLGDQYDRSKQQLDVLGAALTEVQNREGATTEEILRAENAYNRQAKVVNDLGTQLNNTNAEYNDLQNQLTDMQNEVDGTSDSFEEAGGSASLFGQILKSEVVADAIINGVKKLAEGLKDLAFGSSQYADEVLTTATVTGLSTDALQEYMYMTELVDVDVSTITGSLQKLTKNMYSAQDGTGSVAEAFKKLGINVTDSNGSLRSNQEVFNELIDKLGTMENQTEADALAMTVLGKSANDLKPLMAVGSEGLKEFAAEAHEVGYVMDETALATNGAADDAFQRFNKTIDAVKNQIGTAFAPVLTEVLTTLTSVAQNLNDTTAIVDAIGGLIEKGISFIMDNLPEFVNTAMELVVGFAGGLADALPELIPKAVEMITTLVTTLLDNVPQLVSGAGQLVGGLVKGIVQSLPEIVSGAGQIIGSLVKALVEGAVELVKLGASWGKDLIDNFISGIKAKISAVKDAVKNVAQTVKDFLGFSEPDKGPLSNFHTFAPDMMDLFSEGIMNSMPQLEMAVSAVADTTAGGIDSAVIAGAVSGGFAGVRPIIQINYTGSLSQLARVLQPQISMQSDIVGPSMGRG